MATLDAERTHAASLDIQILALERSLSALRAQRTVVQERLDSYKYPVLTLPNEIVCEIFVHFLPVYPKRPPLMGTHSPKNLTHICRKWRAIALTTPELWRATRLSIAGVRDITFERQVHELDAWLSRFGSSPFSLEVVSPPLTPSDASFIFSAARAARWEHLQVNLRLSPSSIIEVPMPLLRHLDLSFNFTEEDIHPTVVFGVPLLSSVVLDGMALTVILPWAQLTSLRLDRVYPDECVPVLQQTSNIVSCELRLYDYPSTDNWPDVTLPRLESLTLVRHARVHIVQTRYLETFIVPALCKLRIEETILENPIDTLTSFVSKSGCRLREIHISGERHIRTDAYSQAFPLVRLSFGDFDEE